MAKLCLSEHVPKQVRYLLAEVWEAQQRICCVPSFASTHFRRKREDFLAATAA